MRNTTIKTIVLLTALSFLFGCSSTKQQSRFTTQDAASIIQNSQRYQLMQLLTQFSDAIDAGNYYEALELLPEKEKELLLDSENKIKESAIRELKALQVGELINYPDVQLRNGKIHGITNHLPGINQSWSYYTYIRNKSQDNHCS